MKQRKYINLLRWMIIIGTVPFMLVSCLKDSGTDPTDEYKQQYEIMKSARNDWDSVKYDVWIAIVDSVTGADTLKPSTKDAILISYNCYNGNGTMVASSDSLTAQKNGLYRSDVIYGPNWVEIQYAIPGFYLAMKKMRVNDSAIVIIPSEMAGYLGPLRYEVKLHKIIKDFNQFEKEQRIAYMSNIGFYDATVKTAIDSTLWYKLLGSGDNIKDTIWGGATVSIELTANYCENLPGLTDIKGRQFFPINNKGKDYDYYYQFSYGFPITPAIDSVIDIMIINGYRQADFITTSANAYGTSGYIHPYVGSYIVPPYMSVHYNVKLVGYK